MHAKLMVLWTVLAASLLGGCGVVLGLPALWGHAVVLVATVGIFVGTLSLGRHTGGSRSEGSAASSTQSRGG